MHKGRRFRASLSDMTHAGIASFCHLLICRDEDLVMKAAAAYEYLGVGTKFYTKKLTNSSSSPNMLMEVLTKTPLARLANLPVNRNLLQLILRILPAK